MFVNTNFGDYVVMITTNQKQRYLAETNNAPLTANLREVFKGIWKSLK